MVLSESLDRDGGVCLLSEHIIHVYSFIVQGLYHPSASACSPLNRLTDAAQSEEGWSSALLAAVSNDSL